MLHPIFARIFEQHFRAINPDFNLNLNKPARSEAQPEDKTMNPEQIARAVEARDAHLFAQQEAADEAWEAACDEAEGEIEFDDLLESLLDLPPLEEDAALSEAARRCPTDLFARAYERLTETKAEQMMRRPAERPDDSDFYDSDV